jgi:hypothetical protein
MKNLFQNFKPLNLFLSLILNFFYNNEINIIINLNIIIILLLLIIIMFLLIRDKTPKEKNNNFKISINNNNIENSSININLDKEISLNELITNKSISPINNVKYFNILDYFGRLIYLFGSFTLNQSWKFFKIIKSSFIFSYDISSTFIKNKISKINFTLKKYSFDYLVLSSDKKNKTYKENNPMKICSYYKRKYHYFRMIPKINLIFFYEKGEEIVFKKKSNFNFISPNIPVLMVSIKL